MGRLSKTRKHCKKARLTKNSKPYNLSSPIDQSNRYQISTCNFYIYRRRNFQPVTIENNSIDLNKSENLVNQQQTSTSQSAILKLFNNMIYKDRPNKEKILSPYLQEKATELLFASHKKSNLKVNILPKLDRLLEKKRKISDKNIEKAIIKKIKQNNREYTPEFISMATNLSTFGHTSISSMIQCTKEIITFLTGRPSKSCLSSICISYWNENKQEPMLTILNMKDLDRCSASTVSLSVEEAISKNLLNPAQCQYWLTDNTAYMSRSTAGAVVKFNQQYSAKTTRIPCGLHALHIASINDLQIASEHPDEVFVEKMLLAHETLSTDEFNDLINRIEYRLVKALDAFKWWMDPWTHLPLSICQLGGIHGPDFAVAIIK
ncbi:14242_t:CDS:2, partial [Racocetra persica]